jgi:exopolyphosphatase/guanosine-5'-triphosphate,3'-diphosphate pyrophosphatase
MKVHKVQAYKAFATSAMRERHKEVVELIKEKADINIEIIDGKGRRRLLLQQICIIC